MMDLVFVLRTSIDHKTHRIENERPVKRDDFLRIFYGIESFANYCKDGHRLETIDSDYCGKCTYPIS